MPNNLTKKLKNSIKTGGPISIATFMQNVLFDPDDGYYQKKQPFGEKGDFITAPEISQIFGEIIGNYAAYIWINQGQPQEFSIIELGPGNASLMDDFLRSTKHIENFHQALKINFVELSGKLRKIQENRLKIYNIDLKHYNNFTDISQAKKNLNNTSNPSYNFIIANEFFDCLPIHQYVRTNNMWHEKLVNLNDEDELIFSLSPNKSKLQEIPPPKEGDTYELSLYTTSIMEDIASYIDNTNSTAILIDYGYTKTQYKNTLQALKKHQFHNILHDLGEADLTAHVDFQALSQVISQYDNLSYHIMTQRDFLLNCGIKERTQTLLQNLDKISQQKILNAANRLISEQEMGSLFKVLLIENIKKLDH